MFSSKSVQYMHRIPHATEYWIHGVDQADGVCRRLANQPHCFCGPRLVLKRGVERQEALVDGYDGLVEHLQLSL
ncbi:hypothetical protein Trco_005929 [Trichoderma cornu-damae]|uniref:Uncharacterized protein n=1 Tax=Trichoderma cornu-damae TaxID=654480 RepID=A0A9P8QI37_9HYPO|nr:hypothetical protein Trco_005929 [Trichoderma cornu-damae]